MSSFETRVPPRAEEPFAPLRGVAVESSAPEEPSIFGALEPARSESESQAAEEAAAAEALAALEAFRAKTFEEGRAHGAAEVRAEFGEAAVAFAAALEDLAKSRKAMRERHESELLGAAVQVAEKILVQELSTDPAPFLSMIHEAVSHILDRDHIRIRVGRALHHFLALRDEDLRAQLEDVREIEVVEDPSLEPTACVIETRYSDLDLGLGSQLDALATALLGES